MTTLSCPAPERLRAFYRGEIPDEQSEELVAHVCDCPDCQSWLNESDDSQDSLIVNLRTPDDEVNLEREPACELGILKALGAFAVAEQLVSGELSSNETLTSSLPKTIGDYEVLRVLGTGGMGQVYLAKHSKLGRLVALKILAGRRLGDHRANQRFESEMRVIGRLSHPNIVTAHDAREIDGHAVLVTEYIDGLDLGQLLLRSGPLPTSEACEIIRQVLDALQYTSEQGFVHRDVKPSNIMLSRQGDVKLLDLGLARFQYGDTETPEITGTGQTMGTADYISPEQITDSRQVDIRSDIYSLGATFYKLLTGRAPFGDDLHTSAFAKMTAHVSQSPTSIRTLRADLPVELERLIESMLAKRPEDRPQRPSDVAECLLPFCGQCDLRGLIEHALQSKLDERVAGSEPKSSVRPKSPQTSSFWRRPISMSKAIAAGFFGFLIGMVLGITIVITNPDGTKSFLQLATGSKVEIQESKENGKEAGQQSNDATPRPGSGSNPSLLNAPMMREQPSPRGLGFGLEPSPLEFGILVYPESSGNSPSIPDKVLNQLSKQLHRTNTATIVETGTARFVPMALPSSVPISEWNNGIQYALVSRDPIYSIPWDEIKGQILSVDKSFDLNRQESSLRLEFDRTLANRLEKLTAQANGLQLAIIANGKVTEAPRLNSPISSNAVITGRFSANQLQDLQERLVVKAPEMPAPNSTSTVTVPAERVIVEYHDIDVHAVMTALEGLLARKPGKQREKLDPQALEDFSQKLAIAIGRDPTDLSAIKNAFTAAWPMIGIHNVRKVPQVQSAPWLVRDPNKCFAFSLLNSRLYPDLCNFIIGWSGDKGLAAAIMDGMKNDPLGPQIDVQELLTKHLGGEVTIETSLPAIAIDLRDTPAIVRLVGRLPKSSESRAVDLRVIGTCLVIGPPTALDVAQERFDNSQKKRY